MPKPHGFFAAIPFYAAIFLLSISSVDTFAQEAGDNGPEQRRLASQSREILKTYCYKCHGAEFKVPRLDVLNHQVLTQQRPDEMAYIQPGNPDASELWNRMGVQQDMPPEAIKARPSEHELEIVRKWIEVGAPERIDPPREFLSETAVLRAIRDDLQRMRSQERIHHRYLTFTHLHNDRSVSNADLRMYQAAFSKLVNSLSRRGELVIPTLLAAKEGDDESKVIFRIDLRDFGWKISTWQSAIQNYPYGIRWRNVDRAELEDDITRMLGGNISGDGLSSLRIDWFIHAASRPPAYHLLLNIPENIQGLEQDRLGVDVKVDFQNGQLMRAGFAGSGVSKHNRLVDRHGGVNTRYYYRSYDFGRSFGKSVISRFPLGPDFEGNEFSSFAFEHDGGEVIFSMPNGMQGYMLIDKEGKRINAAPIKIVRDINESSGSPVIVNGISCIGCHRRGLLDYEDSVRAAKVLGGDALSKLSSLFPPNEKLHTTLTNDRQIFVEALRQVMSPFLEEGEDYGNNLPIKHIEDLPEPVATVCRWYDKDVGSAEVAAELNMKSAEMFQAAVATNDKIRQLGVGPLGDGKKIPRRMWDSLDESTSSVFQRVFVSLGFGTAVSPISP